MTVANIANSPGRMSTIPARAASTTPDTREILPFAAGPAPMLLQ